MAGNNGNMIENPTRSRKRVMKTVLSAVFPLSVKGSLDSWFSDDMCIGIFQDVELGSKLVIIEGTPIHLQIYCVQFLYDCINSNNCLYCIHVF